MPTNRDEPPHIEEYLDFHEDWLTEPTAIARRGGRGINTSGREFTDRAGARWRLHLLWGTVADRAEPVAAVLWSMEPEPRALTKSTLKDVPLSDFVREFRAKASTPNRLAYPEDEAAVRRRQQYGARRGVALSPQALEEVARVYREARETGEPVQAAVASAFHIAKGTAANRIMEARRQGYLPPASAGRQATGGDR